MPHNLWRNGARKFGAADGQHRHSRRVVEPIGPADDEPAKIAERAPRIHIRPTGLRIEDSEFGQHVGIEHRVRAARHPQRRNQEDIGHVACDEARRAQDADTDHGAHANGDPETDAERPVQARRHRCCFNRNHDFAQPKRGP